MKKIVTIIIGATLVAGVTIGVGFAINTAYKNGQADGRQVAIQEVSENIKSLGVAVEEKAKYIQQSSVLMQDVPSEINAEAIDKYIDNLEKLMIGVPDDVQTLLASYLDKWKQFKEIYASEDNNAIQELFNELKTGAVELAKNIQSVYDSNIRLAIEKL